MKYLFAFLIFAVSINCYARLWTNSEGMEFEAELIEIRDKTIVIKSSSDGKNYEYEISKLSSKDQDYIKKTSTYKARNAKADGVKDIPVLNLASATGMIGVICGTVVGYSHHRNDTRIVSKIIRFIGFSYAFGSGIYLSYGIFMGLVL